MSLSDLSTEEIAIFQLIEQGFVGISNGVTIVRAEDARCVETNILISRIDEVLEEVGENIKDINNGEALNLILTCKEFLEKHASDPKVAVLVVFKPGIEEGTFAVEPVARLLVDPSEVINPQFEHTDGAGHAKEDEGTGRNAGDAGTSGEVPQSDSAGTDADERSSRSDNRSGVDNVGGDKKLH